MLFHSKAKDSTNGLNAWAEGGACIIDKKKYETLGGFDHLYNPFYWEDIDLSYQAWKKGYKVIFDPAVVFIHHHESTISQNFSPQFIKKIAYRNQFIFIWKNMEDANFLLQHIAFLPYNMLYYMLKGEVEFVAGFFAALKQLRTVLQKRNLSNKNRVVPDKDILKLFT
jgi:GT2 family glycosyltransferase